MASYLDSHAMDGVRKCFADEFSSIYCFELKGNQRTSGELSLKEGGKVFGGGSRATIVYYFVCEKTTKKKSLQNPLLRHRGLSQS